MRKTLFLASALLLLAETGHAAAQTSKYGIPASGVSAAGAVQLPTSTVAQLPVCDVSHVGVIRMVTDATTPTYNGSLTGGSTVSVTVVCTASGWKSQ